jgi:hypothetical protein
MTIEAWKGRVHADIIKITSGQLRFLGSMPLPGA